MSYTISVVLECPNCRKTSVAADLNIRGEDVQVNHNSRSTIVIGASSNEMV